MNKNANHRPLLAARVAQTSCSCFQTFFNCLNLLHTLVGYTTSSQAQRPVPVDDGRADRSLPQAPIVSRQPPLYGDPHPPRRCKYLYHFRLQDPFCSVSKCLVNDSDRADPELNPTTEYCANPHCLLYCCYQIAPIPGST